jgi:hypothetical protein
LEFGPGQLTSLRFILPFVGLQQMQQCQIG